MDEADAAQSHTERELAAALTRHRAAQDQRPSSGVCASCGEAISPARLRAIPTARQCISCAR